MIKDITAAPKTAFCLELDTQFAEHQVRRTTGRFRTRAFDGQFVTKKLAIKEQQRVSLDNKVRLLVVFVRSGGPVLVDYRYSPKGSDYTKKCETVVNKMGVIDCTMQQATIRLLDPDSTDITEVEVQYLCDDTATDEFYPQR